MIIYTCPECGADLEEQILTSNPPIHKKICRNCGWEHQEGQEVIKIPYSIPKITFPLDYDHQYISPSCRYCSNHPSNGGSGICNCAMPYLDNSQTSNKGKSITITTSDTFTLKY